MGVFSYMKCFCTICKTEINGMEGYGEARCCGKECHKEWQWRRSLAILGKPYTPRKGSRYDPEKDVVEFVQERIAELERER